MQGRRRQPAYATLPGPAHTTAHAIRRAMRPDPQDAGERESERTDPAPRAGREAARYRLHERGLHPLYCRLLVLRRYRGGDHGSAPAPRSSMVRCGHPGEVETAIVAQLYGPYAHPASPAAVSRA